MSNRLRTEIQDEEPEQELPAVENKPEIPDNWLVTLFRNGVITTETATSALPFILFLAFLGMLYIANMHMAEKNIRDIDKVTRQVKEMGVDYKSAKADLAFKSTLSQVTALADTLGLKEPLNPPQKLIVREDIR